MHYNVNWRTDDIEGWALQDYVQWRDNHASHCVGLGAMENQADDPLCWYSIGNNYNNRVSDDWQGITDMPGRPIGFDIRMGVGESFGLATHGQLVDMPVAFKLIFNSCNCPATSYMGTAAPSDITVKYVSDPSAT